MAPACMEDLAHVCFYYFFFISIVVVLSNSVASDFSNVVEFIELERNICTAIYKKKTRDEAPSRPCIAVKKKNKAV